MADSVEPHRGYDIAIYHRESYVRAIIVERNGLPPILEKVREQTKELALEKARALIDLRLDSN